MNQYRTSYDEEYVIASLGKYRRQQHVYPWFILLKIFCALCLAALIAFSIYIMLNSTGDYGTFTFLIVILVTFLVLLIQGPRIDYFFLKRKLRKSPFYGDEVRINLAEDYVSIGTPRSESNIDWSGITHARRVTSGFLLFIGPKNFYWLPDAALVSGTVSEVDSLLRKQIASYR